MRVRYLLARETLLLAAAQVGALAISFFATVLITRALGPEARGIYAWILTLAGFGVQVATLAPYQTVRAVAAQGEQDGRLAASLTLLGFAGAALSLPLLAYGWFESPLGVANRSLLLVAWLAVPLSAAAVSVIALVHLQQRPVSTLWAHLGPKLGFLSLTVVIWAISGLDLGAAIWLNTIVAFVQLALLLFLLGQPTPQFRPSLALLRQVGALLGAGWIGALALFALPRLGLIALGTEAFAAEAGYYSIALTLFELLAILPVSASAALTTRFARDLPTRRARRQAGLVMVGGMGVLCLVAAPASSLFIPLVFGTAFKPAVLPFQELLVATFLATVHQACQPALLARSHRIGIVLPPVAGATLTLSLTYVLVPAFGMQGAVLGTICGFAVLAGLSLLFAGARKAHPDQA